MIPLSFHDVINVDKEMLIALNDLCGDGMLPPRLGLPVDTAVDNVLQDPDILDMVRLHLGTPTAAKRQRPPPKAARPGARGRQSCGGIYVPKWMW